MPRDQNALYYLYVKREDPDEDDSANLDPTSRRESAVRSDSTERARYEASQVAEQKRIKDKLYLDILWTQVKL